MKIIKLSFLFLIPLNYQQLIEFHYLKIAFVGCLTVLSAWNKEQKVQDFNLNMQSNLLWMYISIFYLSEKFTQASKTHVTYRWNF